MKSMVQMSAVTIAVCNFKGGVGKTVLSVNLAAGLARASNVQKKPFRVLLIDADAQANASTYLLGQEWWNRNIYPHSNISLAGVMKNGLSGSFQDALGAEILGGKDSPVFRSEKQQSWENLHLVPSHYDLGDFENEIKPDTNGNLRLKGTKNSAPSFTLLARIFEQKKNEYDYIIIDCPPNLYHMSQNSLYFADNILIPVIPDWLSTSGLVWLLKTLTRKFGEFGLNGKKIRGIVPMLWDTRWKLHKRHKESIVDSMSDKWLQEENIEPLVKGWTIFNGIPRLNEVAVAVEKCRPILDNPNSDAGIYLDEITKYILKGWSDK